MTVEQWLYEWFETYKKPTLKAYSLRNIEQMLRLHTPTWLKIMDLTAVTTLDIDKALSKIPNGRTRVYARQVWCSAFKKATVLGFVERNVVELSERVRYKKKKSRALTATEQKQFLSDLEHSRHKWLMLFYLFSGVRRAEAVHLRWSDIDYTSATIRIRGTKTDGSDRFIFLTDDLRYILSERKKQAKEQGITGNLIFPLALATVSRLFKELCPEHHLHELRHTFITRCAECGINVNVCQLLVGHSTPNMTLGVYTHVMDEFKRKEALKFTIFPKY